MVEEQENGTTEDKKKNTKLSSYTALILGLANGWILMWSDNIRSEAFCINSKTDECHPKNTNSTVKYGGGNMFLAFLTLPAR